eukprot:5353307-Prorocentrum_lima.AAC.1
MPNCCTAYDLLRQIAVAGAIPPYTFQVVTWDTGIGAERCLGWDKAEELRAQAFGPFRVVLRDTPEHEPSQASGTEPPAKLAEKPAL